MNEEYYFSVRNKEPFIIDAGANIGLAVFYFKCIYPASKIYAFEPVEENYHLLNENVKRNKWENVTVFQYALDSVERETEIYIPQNDSLGASLAERKYSYEGKLINQVIKAIPLNSFVANGCDFLKMDIEGAEVRVLRTMGNLLSGVSYLFCEYHFSKEFEDNSIIELLNIMERYGFKYTISKSSEYLRSSANKSMMHIGDKCSYNICAKNDCEKNSEGNG